MLSKKLALGVAVALYGAASGYAAAEASPENKFIYKPFILSPTISNAEVPDWETVNTQYTAWANDGSVFNCSAWTPPVNLVNLDETFTQTRTCSQSQVRIRTDELYSNRLDQTRFEGPFSESRVISVEESQSATGTRDFITGTREETWPAFSRVGGFYGCGNWSPDPATINYGVTFTQERGCSWDEGRSRDVFNTWQSGQETYLRTDSESRTVPYTDTQSSVGTFRDWQPTVSTFTPWADIGADYGHTVWTPSPTTQTANFSQSRDYKRDQERFEQFREQDQVTNDIRNVGAPVRRTQTDERTENRSITTEYTAWTEVNRSAHSAWTPVPTAQTSNFTQSRTYTSNQERERFYTAPVDGELNRQTETKSVESQLESRSISVLSSVGGYGSNYGYGSWSPSASSQTSNFTQTRSYKRDRTRTYTYKSGSSTLHSRSTTETGNFSQSRTISVSYTGWVNSGSIHSCGSYSPTPSSQTSGFTQTRKCKQDQARNRVYKSGSPNIATKLESRTTNVSNSRSVSVTWSGWSNNGSASCGGWSQNSSTGAKSRTCNQSEKRTRYYKVGSSTISTKTETRNRSYTQNVSVTGTSVGSWSGYSNNGSVYSCSSYSPSPSSVDQSTKFTQSRTCKQNQRRQRDKFNNLSDGSKFKTGVEYGSRTINVTQYKYNVLGTRPTEECSSNGYSASDDYEHDGHDWCGYGDVTYLFNGKFIYGNEWSNCRGDSPSGKRGSLTQGGYRYYSKNVTGSSSNRRGQVCRKPL